MSSGSPEMVPWKSPDGIEIQIPREHEKAFSGLAERFNKLTTREQELAKREKEYDSDEYRQKTIDDWWEGVTEDELLEFAKLRGFAGLGRLEKPAAAGAPASPAAGGAAGADQSDLRRDIEAIKAELKRRDDMTLEERRKAEYDEARATLKTELEQTAESAPEFKGFRNKLSQELALSHMWNAMEQSGFRMPLQEAVAQGLKYAVDYEQGVISGHQASKAAGAGLPGSGIGEPQQIEDIKGDPKKAHDYLVSKLRQGLSG